MGKCFESGEGKKSCVKTADIASVISAPWKCNVITDWRVWALVKQFIPADRAKWFTTNQLQLSYFCWLYLEMGYFCPHPSQVKYLYRIVTYLRQVKILYGNID